MKTWTRARNIIDDNSSGSCPGVRICSRSQRHSVPEYACGSRSCKLCLKVNQRKFCNTCHVNLSSNAGHCKNEDCKQKQPDSASTTARKARLTGIASAARECTAAQERIESRNRYVSHAVTAVRMVSSRASALCCFISSHAAFARLLVCDSLIVYLSATHSPTAATNTHKQPEHAHNTHTHTHSPPSWGAEGASLRWR